ncbi:TPA: ArsR family transcriptional regulator [Candidatus Poribacteria bacterium]|nr:ArsR family transcriptional regulator [Candidatus Poribacteria bacterium]
MERFEVTPREAAAIYRCLSSKICRRLFKALYRERRMNITALTRRVGCTNRKGVTHLRVLAEIGIVEEEFAAGLHTFTLKKGRLTELMMETMKVLEGGEGG